MKIQRCAVIGLCLLAACGERTVEPTAHNAPIHYDIVSGNDQSGPAGEELPQPLVVRVTDAAAQPVAGAVVNFEVTHGGGRVFANAVQSDASGIAANYWTLGVTPQTTQRIEVRSVDPASRQKLVHGVFTATATNGPADTVVLAIGLSTAGQVGEMYRIGVRVLDASGFGVPGATINWAVVQGNGSVDSTVSITNSNGVAVTNWTLGTTRVEQSVVATMVGVGNVLFTTVPGRAPAATFVVSDSIKLIDPALPSTVTGQAFDRFGNAVPPEDLYWLLDDGTDFRGATMDLKQWDTSIQPHPAYHRARLLDSKGSPAVSATVWLGRAVFAPLAAGRDHTCQVRGSFERSDLAIYCGGLNTQGQIGGGPPQDATYEQRYAGVGGRAVTTGGAHTCAIGGLNTYCWGANAAGQLGVGSNTPSNTPAQVTGNFYIVSAGADHTCAIDRNARAWCWGANATGQLGIGNTTPSNVPVQVSGDYRFFDVSAGDGFTCATTLRGEVYCWGRNDAGQLGDATSSERLLPVPLAGDGLRFAQIDAGDAHVCAIRKQPREVYCWGSDQFGQVGDGSSGVGVTRRPSRVTIFSAGPYQVSAGARHTCASAVPPTGGPLSAYCWGSNEYAELGQGASGGMLISPSQVNGISNIVFMAAGGSHSCATGSLVSYCWGLTSYLRLMVSSGTFAACGPGGATFCQTTPRALPFSTRRWF